MAYGWSVTLSGGVGRICRGARPNPFRLAGFDASPWAGLPGGAAFPMEVVRNRGEQLVHDALKRPKGPSQRLLRHIADAQTWAVWSVSRRQPSAIGMQQAHVDPEACAAEMQTMELDH